MAEKRDYYDVLKISKTATVDEIKKAYRKKAIKYHPDRNQGDKDAEERFKEAAEAYEVLSDENKRARYDRYGHAGVGGAASGGFGGAGMSMDDIFSQFGDIFGGHFSGFSGFGGGFGSQGGRNVARGSDLRVKVKLNLKEVMHGVEKKIKVKKFVACTSCDGNGSENGTSFTTCSTCNGAGVVTRVVNTMLGQMQTTTSCPDCNGEKRIITKKCSSCSGEGIVKDEDIISINIPAGVSEGMQLSLSGKGNAARRGGVNGDLLILIEEEPDENLVRNDNDLIYSLLLSVSGAALGGSVDVPTVDGVARVNIDAGTQPGKVLRLRGKGLPSVNGYGKGDLLVNINVYIPETLTSEEKKILKDLDLSENFVPSDATKKGLFAKFRNMFN